MGPASASPTAEWEEAVADADRADAEREKAVEEEAVPDADGQLPVIAPDPSLADALFVLHPTEETKEGKPVKMGRQTTIRAGTKSESKSLYCYLHGCRKNLATKKSPPI